MSVFGILGGIVSGVNNIASTVKAVNVEREQWKKHKQLRRENLEDWYRETNFIRALNDKERKWNDFSSVVARAKKAGINPLAVLGAANGGSISSSTQNIEQAPLPPESGTPAMLASVAGNWASLAHLEQDLKAKELENDSKEMDNAMKQVDLEDKSRSKAHEIVMDNLAEESQRLDNSAKELENQFASATFEQRVAMAQALYDNAVKQGRALDDAHDKHEIDMDFYRKEKETALLSAAVSMSYTLRMMQKADEEEVHRRFMRRIESRKISLEEKKHLADLFKFVSSHNLDVEKLRKEYHDMYYDANTPIGLLRQFVSDMAFCFGAGVNGRYPTYSVEDMPYLSVDDFDK